MFRYKVQLQHGKTGEIVETDYIVRWDPEKVDAFEVAAACAAEYTVTHGKVGGGEWRHPMQPLTAVLLGRVGAEAA